MVPYATKIMNVVRSMLLKLPFAKSPANRSSLTIPKGFNGTEVTGNLVENELSYRITAINDYGETVASDELNLTVGSQLANVQIIGNSYTPGILPKGIYHYGVTAVNENGETNIISSYSVRLNGAPSPDWHSNVHEVTQDGQIPSGTYFYAISAVVDNKETTLSSFQEIRLSNENNSVSINFLAVEGASAYNIYGRDRNSPKRIGTVKAPIYTGSDQVITFKDNGTSIGDNNAPVLNETTAGIQITWEQVEGNVLSYKVYGRTSPDTTEMRFIAEVPANNNTYKDQGYIVPTLTPPLRNESGFASGVGIALRWQPVPNATGYRIYGRSKRYSNGPDVFIEEKGLLATIMGQSNTTFIDTGILSPDLSIPFPNTDTTDGSRGVPGVVIPDGQTLVIDEMGVLSVRGGIDSFLGRSDISNVKDRDVLVYNEASGKFMNYDLKDLIFTLISVTDGSVVPIDTKFEEYKENLVQILAALQTFNSSVSELRGMIEKNKNEIKRLDDKIGKTYTEKSREERP